MTIVSPTPTRPPRFLTIDGLRGIAAASVAVFHFNISIARAAPHWLPDWLAAVARQGGLGVDVFFVISGFVIAFSVRDGEYSARYLGRFALRRSIRLDPPYWATIAIELVLIVVSGALFSSLTTPFPSWPKIAAHLFYAQDILRYGGILPVFWTLCFEIQFYLMFVGLLVVWKSIGPRVPAKRQNLLPWLFLAALFVVSLAVRYGDIRLPVAGLALQRWFEFFLGVLTWWVVSGRTPLLALIAAYVAVFATMIGHRLDMLNALPVIVSAFILLVGRADRLDTVMSNRVLQFLGKTSYSLYLIHGPVGERWISLLERIAGPSFGLAWAYFAFVSAFAISMAVATLIWKLVETPTTRLSKRIRLEQRAEAVGVKDLGGLPVPANPISV